MSQAKHHMKPMSRGSRRILFIISVIVFCAIVPLVILYANGYVYTSQTSTVTFTGGIYVRSSVSGSTLSIDGTSIDTFGFFTGGIFTRDIVPGTHTVSVTREGYLPWKKNIYVRASQVPTATAFLVPDPLIKTEIPQLITETVTAVSATSSTSTKSASTTPASTTKPYPNPEYEVVIEALKKKSPLATSTSALVRNSVSIWADRDMAVASWTGDTDTIPGFMCIADTSTASTSQGEICSTIVSIPIRAKVKFIDFAPGRNDVLIVGTADTVFAVELDGRSTRMMVPLYRGRAPDTVIRSGTLYVKDGARLFTIQL